MIQFISMMLVFLMGIYYATIFLHFMGVNIFGKDAKIHVGLSLIPFYYWFKTEKVNVEPPVVKETVVKEIIVEEPVTKKAPVKKKKQKKYPVKKTEKK